MTDAAIIAMFKPGTKWRVRTTGGSCNERSCDEIRTVIETAHGFLSMRNENGGIISCTFPTGNTTREACQGYVRANYGGPIDAIFTLQDTQHTLFYGAP